jgi:hypothetical protein
MAEEPEATKPPSIFSGRYGVQWTIVGIVVSVLVTLLAIKITQQKGEIAYVVSSSNILIFDSKSASSKLTVLDAQNQPITDSVYISEIKIWNSGNQAIEPSEVRDALKVVIVPAKRIIDFKVTVPIRPDIAGFAVTEVNLSKEATPDVSEKDKQKGKALAITWQHFDPRFALKVQVTYVGEAGTESGFHAFLDGYIVGLGPFVKGIDYSEPKSRALLVLLALVLLVLLISLTVFTAEGMIKVHMVPDQVFILTVELIVCWVVVLYVFLDYFSRPTAPI